MQPWLATHSCNRCKHIIPALEEHVRLTIVMANGITTRQRYCVLCCGDPDMAVLFADVCNNPVKSIEVFVCYR